MFTTNDNYNLEIEIPGNWWLKDEEDLVLSGTLYFSPSEGISLDLLGNFPEEKLINPFGVTLFGESSFGQQVTLHQVFLNQSEKPMSSPHSGVSSYLAHRAYIGHHFNDPKEAQFKQINYYPSYLERWLRFTPIDLEFNKGGFQITYDHPETLNFDLTAELDMKIQIRTKGPSIGYSQPKIQFEYQPFVSLFSSKPQSWNNFSEYIVTLNNFFSLIFMESVYPLHIEGVLQNNPDTNNKDQNDHKTISILLPLYESPVSEGPSWFDMLFTYKEVKDEISIYLSNWFEKLENLGPIYDLFFASYGTNRPFPVTMFLNYIQALETYHLRTKSDEADPPEYHRKRMKAILQAVPQEFHDWAARKLGFSNRKTLAQKLRELIDMNPSIVISRVGDEERFIRRVKNSRNYYTHYDPSMEGKEETGGALKGLTITLGLMIEAFLLYEMGFEFTEIRQMQASRRRLPPTWY